MQQKYDVEVFQDEDVDILRYKRDYLKLQKIKDLGAASFRELPATSSTFTTYDQLYAAIITAYRQNGEADSLLRTIISQRQKAVLDFNVEEDAYLEILLSQLLSDGQGTLLLRNALSNKDINFFKQFSFNPAEAFSARRHLEAQFKMFLNQQQHFGLKEKVVAMNEILSIMLQITVDMPNSDAQYRRYKVQLSLHQGLFHYDRFMLSLIIISKLRLQKTYLGMVYATNKGELNWLTLYMKDVISIYRLDKQGNFFSHNLLLHLLWELAEGFLALSQADLVNFDVLVKAIGADAFDLLDSSRIIPRPMTSMDAILFCFLCFVKITTGPSDLSEEKAEPQKYDDTNIFDLKLQEFFLINLTGIKVELHEYFINLQENKFSKLLYVVNKMNGGGKGTLTYFDAMFSTNHNVNFKVSLAFVLFEHHEYIRCESILKQILEQNDSNFHIKVSLIYQLAIFMFTDMTDNPITALQFSKEQLNLAAKVSSKSLEQSFMYFVHGFIYYKMATKAVYESKRIAMRSNSFDYLKIALEVTSNSCQCHPENHFAKLIKGILLLDVGFNQKEGLKLLQEVNAALPFRFISSLALALAFSYNQDYSRAILVIKECCQRFQDHLHICYIIFAYLRYEELRLKAAESRPVVPDLSNQNLRLQDTEPQDDIPLQFLDSSVTEIENLMRKSVIKLALQYKIALPNFDTGKKE